MAGSGSSQLLANALGRLAGFSVAIGVLGTAAQNSLFVVNGGERAVIFNRRYGIEQRVRGEVSLNLQNLPIEIF